MHKAVDEALVLIPLEILEAVVHPTWYGEVGPTKIRYVLAVLVLEALGEEATSTKIARVVGVRPSSVSRPLKELKEAGVLHQEEARGPYGLNEETLAENLHRFRSAKGEFARDEAAEKKARESRLFYKYQTRLKILILKKMSEGVNPEHALKLAKDLVSTPRGIKEYELHKRQEWALRWAEREKRSQKKSPSGHMGRTGGATDRTGFAERLKKYYFRKRGEHGESEDGSPS